MERWSMGIKLVWHGGFCCTNTARCAPQCPPVGASWNWLWSSTWIYKDSWDFQKSGLEIWVSPLVFLSSLVRRSVWIRHSWIKRDGYCSVKLDQQLGWRRNSILWWLILITESTSGTHLQIQRESGSHEQKQQCDWVWREEAVLELFGQLCQRK